MHIWSKQKSKEPRTGWKINDKSTNKLTNSGFLPGRRRLCGVGRRARGRSDRRWWPRRDARSRLPDGRYHPDYRTLIQSWMIGNNMRSYRTAIGFNAITRRRRPYAPRRRLSRDFFTKDGNVYIYTSVKIKALKNVPRSFSTHGNFIM